MEPAGQLHRHEENREYRCDQINADQEIARIGSIGNRAAHQHEKNAGNADERLDQTHLVGGQLQDTDQDPAQQQLLHGKAHAGKGGTAKVGAKLGVLPDGWLLLGCHFSPARIMKQNAFAL